jgi:translation initiation factor 2 beta subunit (eIF-2beta)/eIF-5
LKHKNRDESFSLGIIDYKDSISKSEICDAVLKPIQKRRERSVNIKPPKLKKYIPTVVLYDGDIIRKEMRVTKVPRTFRHLGTKNYGTVRRDAYSLAEEKWMELRDEAERQARKLDEVLAQNAQMMREYENEVRAILNKPISGEEIESELKKYVLLIERSRSKIPSDVKK